MTGRECGWLGFAAGLCAAEFLIKGTHSEKVGSVENVGSGEMTKQKGNQHSRVIFVEATEGAYNH